MSEYLVWQLFLTRWLMLAVVALLVGAVVSGVSYRWLKDAEPYKGRGFWAATFLALVGLHVASFLYHRTLPHWTLSLSAGFWFGFLGTWLLYAMNHLLQVKANRASVVIAAAVFVIVANFTPLESHLICWLKCL